MKPVPTHTGHSFLQGGGEMGELIRNYDWSQTSIGLPDSWPQSLRTTLSIILNSKFPMFLLWGRELLGFYNDAYRPTLGADSKHPHALGKSGAELWPEAWPAVKPMIDQVLGGEAIWLEDQLIPIYRGARLEDVYWTFSYSPVHDESGAPAGVFIMCTETTKTFKSFQESNDQLQFAIEAAELATWDFNPITNTFTANARYTEWFGIPAAHETDNSLALNAIAAEDRDRVVAAYTKALDYNLRSGYDIEYTIRPQNKPERILRARGKAWFNNDKAAYRFNGTLQDVTKEVQSRRRTEEREAYFRELTDAVPAIIWITEPGGSCTYLNRNWYAYTGQTKEAAEGFGWLSATHPDDKERAGQIFLEANANKTSFSILYRLRDSNGTYRWAIDSGSPKFDAAGLYEGMIGTVVDVHEQKLAEEALRASEERYQNFVHRSSEGIWRFEVDRPVPVDLPLQEQMRLFFEAAYLAECNDAMAQMNGYQSAEALTGMRLSGLFPRDAATEAYFRHFIGSGYRMQDAESKELLKNGETRHFSNNLIGIVEDGLLLRAWGTRRDITAQRAAEEKIRESEARLQAIIAVAPVAISVFRGRDLVIEMANQTFIDILGKGDTITGRPLREAMPELTTEGQPFLQILDDVYTSGNMFQTLGSPVKIVRNGIMTDNYYNITYTPLYDADGAVYAILEIAIEVTEQVLARKRIEKSEQQIRTLVESAPFPIGVYTGKEMQIQLANQSLIEAWGKGADIIGKRYADVLPEVDSAIYKQLDDVYTTGIPYQARNRRVDLVVDGKLQPYYFNYDFTPLSDANGTVYGVMNTGADVTDLNLAKQKTEESERNLRLIILQAPVAICIFRGPQYTLEIVNPLMEVMLGKSRTAIEGLPFFEAIPELRNQGLEEILRNVVESKTSFVAYGREFELPRNGKMETVYIDYIYEPLQDASGVVNRIVVVATNVTPQVLARRKIEEVVAARTVELAQTNETLLKTNQELSRSNANLEEFAYAASHDLKEPVRKIHFFGDRLRGSLAGRLTEEESRVFERMEVAARRMGSLIDDLLTYSQISLRPRSFETVDMNQLIDLVLGDLDLEIEEKGATINVDKLFTVRGHHRQLQQAFQNLIGNALKYTKPGNTPQVNISYKKTIGKNSGLHLEPEEQDREYFVVQVADNGIGFEQKDAERIFNVFTRLHGNSEFRGTGVGLSIVRKVLENHNGYITAQSSPGAGSVFMLYLPAAGA